VYAELRAANFNAVLDDSYGKHKNVIVCTSWIEVGPACDFLRHFTPDRATLRASVPCRTFRIPPVPPVLRAPALLHPLRVDACQNRGYAAFAQYHRTNCTNKMRAGCPPTPGPR